MTLFILSPFRASALAILALPVLLAAPMAARSQVQAPAQPACEAAVPDVPPRGNLNLVVTLDPETVWQPRNGEVQFTIRSMNSSLQIGTIDVWFRWRNVAGACWIRSPAVRLMADDVAAAATFAAAVPAGLDGSELPSFPSRIFDFSSTGAYTGLDIVPIADFRIMAMSEAGPLDLVLPVGITSRYFAFFGGLLVVGIAWVVLYAFGRRRCVPGGRDPVLTIIAARDGRASLSTLQIILWSFVVGASAVYVMILSGNLIAITEGTLVLLGISGVATLGNKLQARGAREDPPAQEPASSSVPPPPGAHCVPLTLRKPLWSDLVVGERDGEIEPSRVQMLFFTVIVALFVALRVVTSGRIPEIPVGYLALMGISNGVYLTAKFMPDRRSQPAG